MIDQPVRCVCGGQPALLVDLQGAYVVCGCAARTARCYERGQSTVSREQALNAWAVMQRALRQQR